MAQQSPTSSLLVEHGRRRSARVLLSVPVFLCGTLPDGSKFEEETRTLVVNAHGALLAVTIALPAGQQVTLTHKLTRNSIECKTVNVGKPQGGKAQIGVEFLKATPMFWMIDFPPEDWVVPES
jgi:hypothetical protein